MRITSQEVLQIAATLKCPPEEVWGLYVLHNPLVPVGIPKDLQTQIDARDADIPIGTLVCFAKNPSSVAVIVEAYATLWYSPTQYRLHYLKDNNIYSVDLTWVNPDRLQILPEGSIADIPPRNNE